MRHNDFTPTKKQTRLGFFILGMFYSASSFSNAEPMPSPPTSNTLTSTQIELPIQGASLEYKRDVRLLQVLEEANSLGSQGYFPLAAQLFNASKADLIEKKKNDVLRVLDTYAFENREAKLVKKQLASFNYQYRVFINLDKNVVLSQTDKNPLLVSHFSNDKAIKNTPSSERFSLYLTARPTHIQMVGVMQESAKLTLIEHGGINDYIDALPNGKLGHSVDKSFAYAIQPDGTVQDISYAYWNEQPTYLAPGAIVFMPFESLPSQYSTLNQDIVELLRHKVNL